MKIFCVMIPSLVYTCRDFGLFRVVRPQTQNNMAAICFFSKKALHDGGHLELKKNTRGDFWGLFGIRLRRSFLKKIRFLQFFSRFNPNVLALLYVCFVMLLSPSFYRSVCLSVCLPSIALIVILNPSLCTSNISPTLFICKVMPSRAVYIIFMLLYLFTPPPVP